MRARRHRLVVVSRLAPVANAEGIVTRPAPSERDVSGAAIEASAQALRLGDQLGVRVEAVAQLPRGDTIDRSDLVRVLDGPLVGEWDVTAIRRGPLVTRAYLARTEA